MILFDANIANYSDSGFMSNRGRKRCGIDYLMKLNCGARLALGVRGGLNNN